MKVKSNIHFWSRTIKFFSSQKNFVGALFFTRSIKNMLTIVRYIMCLDFVCLFLVMKHENWSTSLQSVQNIGVLYVLCIVNRDDGIP